MSTDRAPRVSPQELKELVAELEDERHMAGDKYRETVNDFVLLDLRDARARCAELERERNEWKLSAERRQSNNLALIDSMKGLESELTTERDDARRAVKVLRDALPVAFVTGALRDLAQMRQHHSLAHEWDPRCQKLIECAIEIESALAATSSIPEVRT